MDECSQNQDEDDGAGQDRRGSQKPPSPDPAVPALHYEYDAVCGRLLVTSERGGFVIFHGVPIDVYIRLRFSAAPGRYLRDRMIGVYPFLCSAKRWPKS